MSSKHISWVCCWDLASDALTYSVLELMKDVVDGDVDGHDVDRNPAHTETQKKLIDIFYTACTPKNVERMKRHFLISFASITHI